MAWIEARIITRPTAPPPPPPPTPAPPTSPPPGKGASIDSFIP